MKRLGMSASDDTILRHLKRTVPVGKTAPEIRVAGIDDWSWRKGTRYGTIVVDLEKREVVDVLPDRTAIGTANWLKQHPQIEVVSRDRCGLYAQGAREGAPQALQVADRFHLLENRRVTIEAQLSRVNRSMGRAMLPATKYEEEGDDAPVRNTPRMSKAAEHQLLTRQANIAARQVLFDQVQKLHAAGTTFRAMVAQTGCNFRTIKKWTLQTAIADRKAREPTSKSPKYFQDYMSRRWAEGCVRGRILFQEIKQRGYIGSCSHLEHFLSRWRSVRGVEVSNPMSTPKTIAERAVDPATGWLISPIVAASLCIKPRGLLTPAALLHGYRHSGPLTKL